MKNTDNLNEKEIYVSFFIPTFVYISKSTEWGGRVIVTGVVGPSIISLSTGIVTFYIVSERQTLRVEVVEGTWGQRTDGKDGYE